MTSDHALAAETRRTLMLGAAAVFLAAVVVVFLMIRAHDQGHFVYSLDDPYIHLALSEQIAHGHYGINPGEPSSPSSSILWPFLLAPFTGHAIQVYIPLLLNIGFGLASVLLLADMVSGWPPRAVRAESAGWWLKGLVLLLMMFVANLVGLLFLGMEHELQVLLAIACAAGVCRAWEGAPVPRWCLIAACVAPLVRYEDLALTLAVALVLLATKRRPEALLVCIAGALPLAAFGLFLRHLGLPMLPLSVLVKAAIRSNSSGLHPTLLGSVSENLRVLTYESVRWPLLALAVVLLSLRVRERDRTRRGILLAGVAVASLHLAFGQFGWFYRYEVYALIFVTLIFCRAVIAEQRVPVSFVLVLFFLASPYFLAARETAEASQEIYLQQYQMRRFVDDYYGKNVAVNDLGLVSYDRPEGVRILDIYGLGSLEAAGTRDKSAAWLQQIVAQHDVGLAVIYPDWFHIPQAWTAVARMCSSQSTYLVSRPCVVFFSTSPAATAGIREDLARFAPTLPPRVTLRFDPPPAEVLRSIN